MQTKEEILAFVDKSYNENLESTHESCKQMAKEFLEYHDGNYDDARMMAQTMAMVCKLAYELLTKIQKFEEIASGKEVTT